MATDLPSPDVLRQRIEAERRFAQGHLDERRPTVADAEAHDWAVYDGLTVARCVSALARLDRHGGDHWCAGPDKATGKWYGWPVGNRCPDYRDTASEYPEATG